MARLTCAEELILKMGNADLPPIDTQKLTLEVTPEGVAWLQIRERLPVGIDVLRAVRDRLDEIDPLVHSSDVRAVVLASASSDGCSDGYTAHEIGDSTVAEIMAWAGEAQAILLRLSELEVPTLALIDGAWIGSPAELALACSHRIATNRNDTTIGFRHASRGLVPAWGSTVRLPRLLGIDASARLLLEATPLDVSKARAIGLIDRIIPYSNPRERTIKYVLRQARGAAWRERNRALRHRLVEGSGIGRRLLTEKAERRYLVESPATEPADDASLVVLDLIARSGGRSPEHALTLEAAAAGHVMTSDEARGRLHAERVHSKAQRPRLSVGLEVGASAVLGWDRTAGDLAALLLGNDDTVRWRVPSRRDGVHAVEAVRRRVRWERSVGRISATEATRRLSGLLPVTGYGGFGTLDLVVAAGDDVTASLGALAACEDHVRRDCILALHAPIPSDGSGTSLRDPARFLEIALSLPSDRFPLLEMRSGPETGERTLDAVSRLAIRLGITPIEVHGTGPTPGTRLLAAYFSEASRLLDEGATVAQVDESTESLGFDVGPFRRMDAIGVDRVQSLLLSVNRLAPDPPTHRWLARLGQDRSTFYTYRGGIPRAPNPMLPLVLSDDAVAVSNLIRRRIRMIMMREAFAILQDGAVTEPGHLDLISIRGIGYHERSGGLVFHASRIGLDRLADELSAVASRYGARFAPPELLLRMARTRREETDLTRLDRLDKADASA